MYILDADRPWRRQVSSVERIRSIQRLPRSDWVPPEIRGRMTGPRIARSASLFVGVNAGQLAERPRRVVFLEQPAAEAGGLGWRARVPCSSRSRNRSRNGASCSRSAISAGVLGHVGADERAARGGLRTVGRRCRAPACRACRARLTCGDLGQLANQMSAPQLLLQDINPVVADVAVGGHEPAEVPKSSTSSRLVASYLS